MIYDLVRPMLFRLDPERAHDLAMAVLSLIDRFLVREPSPLSTPRLETSVANLRFPNPVGLAAGCDKDGVATRVLAAAGFGFVEVGTVTPEAQPGNPRPRIFRLPDRRAVINRLGFNSPGAHVVAQNLRRRSRSVPVGVNVGPNKNTPRARVVDSLVPALRALAPYADYLVLNLSSPNTPGLCDLLGDGPLRETLGAFVRALEDLSIDLPLLLKLSPDLPDVDLERVADTALEHEVAGLIATNTTVSREGLDPRWAAEAGGLSGAPIRDRSDHVIALLRRRVGCRLPIVGVGGICDAQDAYRKIRAGASLVQLYTGLVYGGPGVVRRIAAGLDELLARDGHATIGQAVGSALA